MKLIINQPRASYFVGGAELISFEHAANLFKLGNEVCFFTISPQSIGLESSAQYKSFCKDYGDKINIVEIDQNKKALDIYNVQPGQDRCRWNVESIFYNQQLYAALSNQSEVFDAVLSYYNLDAAFVPEHKVKKNVLYLCGTPKQQDDFQGSFLSVYDKVIAISDTVQSYWEVYCKQKIEIVSTGVNFDKFALKAFGEQNNKQINLLYVGRLISRKNVNLILHAAEKLSKKHSVNLTIVGDGPEKKQLELISKTAIFTGVVANTEEYYKQADIFVSPSEYGEGVQGVILEAMSCGLTVVATNSDINKSLLQDGRGFVIEPTSADLLRGIEDAINANRQQIGLKARAHIIKNYSWLEMTKKIEECVR